MKWLIIITLIPLLAILLFYSTSPKGDIIVSKDSNYSAHQLSLKPTISMNGAMSESDLQARKEETHQRLEEATRRSDESGKKLANHLTPEYRAKLVDFMMNRRASEYEALFNSWRIDESVKQSILTLIRERELRMQEHGATMLAGGHTTRSDFRSKKEIEEAMSELQLTHLLGKERFNELDRLEADMFQREHPKIRPRLTDG